MYEYKKEPPEFSDELKAKLRGKRLFDFPKIPRINKKAVMIILIITACILFWLIEGYIEFKAQ